LEKAIHNGIEVITYSRKETRLMELYEESKKLSISQMAKKYDKKPDEIYSMVKAGERLANL